MSENNKRKFKRSATNVLVKFRKEEGVDKRTRDYLDGIAKDYGRGGIFLSTEHPLEKGSILSLEFKFNEDGNVVNVQAKAVVRWTRRFFKPRGMGVEFYEFTGLEDIDAEKYLEQLLGDNDNS